MAVQVSISLFGDEFFRRRIWAIRHRARDLSPILRRIGDEWLGMVEEQFATEGARGGSPWAPLARDTKLRRGSAHPILVETGDLLIHMTDPDNLNVSDGELSLHLPATERTKAEAHQYGYENVRAGKHVAARPMVRFTMVDEARWGRKIENYLFDGFL